MIQMMQDSPQLEITTPQRIHNASAEILSELKLDRLLTSIIRSAKDLLHSHYAHLYRYNADRDVLISWIPFELPERTVTLELSRGEGAAGKVLASGRPLRVDDHDSWEGRTEKWPHGTTGHMLHVPVRHGQRLLAVLAVGRRQGDEPYTTLDQEMLELLASQAAVAISNAQLYHEAEQRSRELSHLYDSSLDVTALLEVDEVLYAVLHRTTDLARAQISEVVVYDEQKGIITDFLNLGLRDMGMPLDVHRPGDSPSGLDGLVIRKREPVRVHEYDR